MFTGSPAHIGALSGPTIFGLVSGRLCRGGRWTYRPRCRGIPVVFRPPAAASWESCPTEEFRPSYDRPTRPAPMGSTLDWTTTVSTFHSLELRPGWALFAPRPRGALTAGLVPALQEVRSYRPVTISSSDASDNKASSRVHSRSPTRRGTRDDRMCGSSSSPRPGAPGSNGDSLGQSPICDARHDGRRTFEHSAGAMSPTSSVLQST